MTTAFTLLTTAAVLCLILVGFASLVGATELRDRLAKIFAGLLLLAFVGLPALSVFLGELRASTSVLTPKLPEVGAPRGLVPAVVLGHFVAAVLVIRRYVGVEGRKRDASERERARTRERARLPPSGEEHES